MGMPLWLCKSQSRVVAEPEVGPRRRQGAVEGVDGNGGTGRDVDKTNLGLKLAADLIGIVAVVGVGNDADEAEDGILIALARSGSGGLAGEGGNVGGNLEHVHGVVVVLDCGTVEQTHSGTIGRQEAAIGRVDIDVDGDIARNVDGVVEMEAAVDEGQVDPGG